MNICDKQMVVSLPPFSVNLQDYPIGQHRVDCPHCHKRAGQKTLGITVHAHDDIVAHCFRCEYTQSYTGARGTTYAPRALPVPKVPEPLNDYWLDLWSRTEPLHGVAVDYLRSRNCVIPPDDSDLRYIKSLKHPSGYVGAALVGLVTHAQTREPLSLHRTWITSTGKAQVEPPRLFAAGQSIRGGVIRLWSDEFVTQGLGVAEGIETALSLAHVMAPVWALMDAGHLAAFEVMRGIECLTIAVDQDPAGIKAARACAKRWKAAGHSVILTNQEQNDFNDFAKVAE